MKVIWGVIVGVVSWVMVSFVGIDGIKMLSNLGGLPAMLIVLLATGSLWVWLKHPERLDAVPTRSTSSRAAKDDA